MVSLKMASGVFAGHLLNLHAAGLRGHEDQPACGAVEHDAQIQFTVDGSGLLDQQPLDLLSERAGLVGHQRHAKNLPGVEFGLLASAGHFHAAALAAASGVNLRLDHDACSAFGKELAGHRRGFFQVLATSPLGTATPYFARISFAWYSCIFTFGDRQLRCRLGDSGSDRRAPGQRDRDSGMQILSCLPKEGQPEAESGCAVTIEEIWPL